MALGRGLSELLGEVETAYDNSTSKKVSELEIYEIQVDSIKPNPTQPRKVFDDVKLGELANSIKEHGLLQPITVRVEEGEYILVAGERRLRAHKLAGLETVKATILDTHSQRQRELALIENIQRDDLNIIELAYSYAQLMNEHELTHEELSNKVCKSRSSITNTLRLLSLSVYVQQLLGNDKITAGHAKVLVGLNEDEQKLIADSIIGQKLSVRDTEKLVQDMKAAQKESDDSKSDKIKTKSRSDIDFSPISSFVDKLKDQKLKVKTASNYLKIEIKSQEDIQKLSELFT